MELPFADRADAGRELASGLSRFSGRRDVVVLALPRGGVPVAFEVARALRAPMDVLLVRKLGVPGHEELAMGAIASGGVRVLNTEVVQDLDLDPGRIDQVTRREMGELARRERAYRGTRPRPELAGKTVVVVDDGLATGATMRAAVQALRAARPARIVVAVPVAARETAERLSETADEVVCIATPQPFFAVGSWYQDFTPVDDREVRSLLREAEPPQPSRAPLSGPETHAREEPAEEVEIPIGDARIRGTLVVPEGSRGVVAFAHGSGSGRFSPRNRFVASVLREARLGTLLADLLTRDEESVDRRTAEHRFDIDLLAGRLVAITDWLVERFDTRGLPLGLFGSSTGAAAALVAAAERPGLVSAVVSRGGRPDLAGTALGRVTAATLLIVGGNDEAVLGLNEEAFERLTSARRKELVIVPGASHLFEEPGTLEEAALLSARWFRTQLGGGTP